MDARRSQEERAAKRGFLAEFKEHGDCGLALGGGASARLEQYDLALLAKRKRGACGEGDLPFLATVSQNEGCKGALCVHMPALLCKGDIYNLRKRRLLEAEDCAVFEKMKNEDQTHDAHPAN